MLLQNNGLLNLLIYHLYSKTVPKHYEKFVNNFIIFIGLIVFILFIVEQVHKVFFSFRFTHFKAKTTFTNFFSTCSII